MDFTWLADFIKNFPKKKTKAIIIILIQFILLCIVWWVLEAIIEWVSSKDSIFWGMAETAFYVLICFFWLSWLTDAALDLDDEKEDALNSKWEVLDFLTKSYGKEKETLLRCELTPRHPVELDHSGHDPRLCEEHPRAELLSDG